MTGLKLELNKQLFLTLRSLGIQGLTIIEFDDVYGPRPRFAHSMHSKLVRRLLEDQIFSAKISILAKYASEAKLADSRIVIETFENVDERTKTHYIIAQISENADYTRVRIFLRNLCKKLRGIRGFKKEAIEKLMHEAI